MKKLKKPWDWLKVIEEVKIRGWGFSKNDDRSVKKLQEAGSYLCSRPHEVHKCEAPHIFPFFPRHQIFPPSRKFNVVTQTDGSRSTEYTSDICQL